MLLQVHGFHFETRELFQALHLHHVGGTPLFEGLAILIEGHRLCRFEFVINYVQILVLAIQAPNDKQIRVIQRLPTLVLLGVRCGRGVNHLFSHPTEPQPLSLRPGETRGLRLLGGLLS